MHNPTESFKQIEAARNLDEIYPVLTTLLATPGWHKKRPSLWKAPRTAYTPQHWSYEVCAAAIDKAGQWISTELAERRNTLLFNPVGDNDYDTVRTLVAAYQMIKPGEHARAHRHTPNAMRLVLDAPPGCFTVVDGVELPMVSGDFLLTPGGCWHSHYHEEQAGANAYWIDFLDVPLVHRLEPMFFEEHPDGYQPINLRSSEHPWYFPAQATREQLAAQADIDGLKRLVLNTQHHIPTVEITYLGFPAPRRHAFSRDTASRILAVTSGCGKARIGALDVQWKRGDVMAVPSWHDFWIEPEQEASILEVSDKPVLQKLGFYRQG
ncbi:MAG: cupin domain-containing protein [Pigmentiphaga sp.]|nr:cupin domain-containing protein [Pigmentiphaga sp.]